MTLPTNLPPICALLSKSELVDRETLDRIVAAALDANAGAVGDETAFEERLLGSLVASEAINGWQASQLRAGRVGFRFGEYRVVDLLGQGGYGLVFLGRPFAFKSNRDRTRPKMVEDVAIKAAAPKRSDESGLLNFTRENEIAKLLKSDLIVRCFGSGREGATHYGVYEYVDGGSVSDLLRRFDGRLPYRVAAHIVSEAAKGLDYLRRVGLVHRDVKPANILLMRDGKVKLADFGFVSPIEPFSESARLSELGERVERLEADLAELKFDGNAGGDSDAESSNDDARCKRRRTRRVKGTPDYLAPDQTLDPDRPSHLWDVYSLGCSLYLMLTGSVPFPTTRRDARETVRAHLSESDPPPAPSEFDPLIPEPLSSLTMKMMAQRPENRVESAARVVEELRRWTRTPEEIALDKTVFKARGGNDVDFWSPECLEACLVSPATSAPSGAVPGFGPSEFGKAFDGGKRLGATSSGTARNGGIAGSGFAGSESRGKSSGVKSIGGKTFGDVESPARRSLADAVNEEAERLEQLNARLVRYVVYPLAAATLVAAAIYVVTAFF